MAVVKSSSNVVVLGEDDLPPGGVDLATCIFLAVLTNTTLEYRD